eukprot:5243595-Alexandrium_andersonii.AAC.1
MRRRGRRAQQRLADAPRGSRAGQQSPHPTRQPRRGNRATAWPSMAHRDGLRRRPTRGNV